MPSPIAWSLVYGETALDFGSVDSGVVFRTAPEIGPPEIETDDARVPRGDGVIFGADFLGGRTISFDLDVVGADEASTRAAVGPLERAWRGDALRSVPGAMAMLVARYPGVERVTFGRPRRFASVDTLTPHGVAEVVADFATVDAAWHSAEEHEVSVSIAPAPSGGLLAPLRAPLTTTRTSDRSTSFEVGGLLPAWPVFEIEGPIADPTIEVVGVLRMDFRLTLGEGERLVVDTRPWRRSVLRAGANAAGTLTRTSTRLSRASLPPGRFEYVLRGSSTTGTASARLRWRDAFPSL